MEVRLNTTENEKLVQTALGLDSEYKNFNMQEQSIDNLIAKEKARKFNNEVEKYNAQLDKNNKECQEAQETLQYDINLAEIKPMLARILVKPFKQNPFQKLEVQGGIIVDTGGYNPHIQFNEQTGKNEEQEQFIKVGCVIEVGPEVKYLTEGDVIYYRKDTVVPVPFFKQNLVSLNENQVIAVVNEGLEKRWKKNSL